MTIPTEKEKAKKLTEGSLSSSIKTKINQVSSNQVSSTSQDGEKSLESSDNFGSYEKYIKQ